MAEIGRLIRRPEFLRVAAGRRKRVMPGVVVQALPRNGDAGSAPGHDGYSDAPAIRLGITVSRKVGNAVQRNRARRRLRAAAWTVLPEVGRPGYDYVIIGRRATLTRPYADLLADLRTAVRKLNAQDDRTAGKGRGRIPQAGGVRGERR